MDSEFRAAVDTIKRDISMEQVVRYYGLEPNRSGYICCPFHHEDTPSLKIYPNSYYCFGCGSGGSVIDFAQKYTGNDFVGAVKALCGAFGIPLKQSPYERQMYRQKALEAQRERNKRMRESKRLQEQYNAALDLYVACDKAMREFAPKNENDICEAYALAVKLIDEASYRLTEFDMREVK
jgi:DNA primase